MTRVVSCSRRFEFATSSRETRAFRKRTFVTCAPSSCHRKCIDWSTKGYDDHDTTGETCRPCRLMIAGDEGRDLISRSRRVITILSMSRTKLPPSRPSLAPLQYILRTKPTAVVYGHYLEEARGAAPYIKVHNYRRATFTGGDSASDPPRWPFRGLD